MFHHLFIGLKFALEKARYEIDLDFCDEMGLGWSGKGLEVQSWTYVLHPNTRHITQGTTRL